MSERLQYMLARLDAFESAAAGASPLHRLDARAKVVAAVVLLAAILSTPLTHLTDLVVFFLFPLVAAPLAGMRYGVLLRRSLIVVPFAAMLGIWNLFADRTPVLFAGPIAVTAGWIAFLSILARGVLSLQVLLLLTGTTGFYALCRALRRLGVPALFTTQLLFVHRYMRVLAEEALGMARARDARSFGRRSYPLALWATLIGQLLVRSFERADRIGGAMLARGFTGRMPDTARERRAWSRRDSTFLILLTAAVAAIRWGRPAEALAAWLGPLFPQP